MDKLIEELIKSFGVSSKEENIKSLIRKELENIKASENIHIEIKEDVMGNIIAKLGEGKEKVMFCTHMDNPGIMATLIDNNGFARISPIGNLKPEKLVRSFIKFQNGTVGRIDASKDKPSRDDLFMDLGVSDKETAHKRVKEGDVAELTGERFISNNRIVAPNLHSKLGCYVFLKAIRRMNDLKKLSKELYFVFSSQMEPGFRGARAATSEIKPNMAIVLDSLEAKDYVGGNDVLKLEGGPILCIYDKSLVVHNEIKEIINNAAERSNIALQYNIGAGRNEGGLIHKEVGGVKTAMIGIPCRYMYTSGEMMSLKDTDSVIDLISSIIEEISK